MNADDLDLLKDSVQLNKITLDMLKEVLYSYKYDQDKARTILGQLEGMHKQFCRIVNNPVLAG